MNSINRKFGRLMSKAPADTTKASMLLKDYEDADSTLAKIIEAAKAWRDAWVSILTVQLAFITSIDEIYQPIIGTNDSHRDNPVLTPREVLIRTSRLKAVCHQLKTDLMEEVGMMDSRVIQPATEVKGFLLPMRKTIKKRENKRVDWERSIDRVNTISSKLGRSDKENAALAKAEEELAQTSDAFKAVDGHLRDTLPPLITAAFSILPHLLNVQILIQNALLAQYYTIIHNYCEETGFPSPPPPTEDVVAAWTRDFKPVQAQVEAINCIAHGRSLLPHIAGDEDRGRKPSSSLRVFSGLGKGRPSPGNKPGSLSPHPDMHLMRVPSSNSIAVSPPRASPSPDPSASYTPDFASGHLTPISAYSTNSAHSPAGPSSDYFQRAVAQKKKPPPPPLKRSASDIGLFAIALYAFDGQSQGDLSFRENDRIKVTKKTDSTDDWWEGELRGRQGSFPANYCKIG